MTSRRLRSSWTLLACLLIAPLWTATAASATSFGGTRGLHCGTCNTGPNISLGSGGNVQSLPSLVGLELQNPGPRPAIFGSMITSPPTTGIVVSTGGPGTKVPEPHLAGLLLAAISAGLYRARANARHC